MTKNKEELPLSADRQAGTAKKRRLGMTKMTPEMNVHYKNND
jgi:hypothetical protein